jgi:tetratricopeptide (TPR) repeat protein
MTLRELNLKIKELKQQGDLQSAASILREWSSRSGKVSDKWFALSVLVHFAIEEGHLKEALSYCSELMEIDSDDPSLHSLLGQIYRLNGELQKAEEEFRRAIELGRRENDPNIFVYVTELGKVLLLEGRLDECESLGLSDWDPTAEVQYEDEIRVVGRLALLGRLYRQKKHYQKSIDYFRRALRVSQSSKRLLFCGDLLEELMSVIREAKKEEGETLDNTGSG